MEAFLSAAARVTPSSDFQQVIEVPEEEEPAPKRKKVMSVAARAWGHNFALLEAFRRREWPRRRVPPKHEEGGTKLRVACGWTISARDGRRVGGARRCASTRRGVH